MQNDTWRPQLKTGISRRRTKLRLVFSVLVAGLFVLLIYLLLQPFWFPKTQFAVAITQPTSISGIRPSRIALNDVAYFSLSNSPEDHSNKIPQLVLSNLNYPADAARFEKSIQSLRMRAADVFILYVSGYGITADGHTYLLCDNFDPSDTDLGKLPLRDLLQQLASCRAQTKLLILDVAQITYDPRLGVVSNVFPEVLSREVTNINHPNLWVLTSNSVLESSHVDPSSGRSIFAHFVIQGLQGEADLNENQSVDVDELYHFVSANVFNWVQRYTNGHATQTPQVIRSGKIFLPSSKSPKLISVITKEFDNEAETDETTENAAVSNLKNNQQIAASTGFSVPSKDMMSTKVLSRSIPKDLAKDSNKKADRQATEDKTLKDDSNGQTSPNDPDDKTSEQADNEEQPANGSTIENEDVPNGEDAVEENRDNGSMDEPDFETLSVAESLYSAWQFRDELTAPMSARSRPVDYAPHLWRNVQEHLLSDDRRYQGRASTQETADQHLSEQTRLLWELSVGRNLTSSETNPSADQLATSLPANSLRNISPRSIALAKWIARETGRPLEKPLRQTAEQLDVFCTGANLSEFTDWVSNLPPETDHFVEIEFSKWLTRHRNVNWKLLQLALHARCKSEMVAAMAFDGLDWIKPVVEMADHRRIKGEIQLADRIGVNWENRARSHLNVSLELYSQALDKIHQIRMVRRLAADLVDRIPFYLRWHLEVFRDTDLSVPDQQILDGFFEDNTLHNLLEYLDHPDVNKYSKLISIYHELSDRKDKVERSMQTDSVQTLMREPVAVGNAWRIQMLLQFPMLKSADREKLLEASVRLGTRFTTDFQMTRDVSQVKFHGAILDDWTTAVHGAKLTLQLAELAFIDREDEKETFGLMNHHYQKLETSYKNFTAGGEMHSQNSSKKQPESNSASGNKSIPNGEDSAEGTRATSLVNYLDNFGRATREFYRRLPDRIKLKLAQNSDLTDRQTRSSRLQILRNCFRALRFVDARDAQRLQDIDIAKKVRDADWHNLMLWHHRRLLLAATLGIGGEDIHSAEAAESYRSQANAIILQPKKDPPSSNRIDLSAPQSIALSDQIGQEIDVELDWRGRKPTDVWLVLNYDAENIEVQNRSDHNVYHQPSFNTEEGDVVVLPETSVNPVIEAAEIDLTTPQQMVKNHPNPTLRIERGEPQVLRLSVRRRQEDSQLHSSHLVIKALALVNSDDYVYTRRPIELNLPIVKSFDLIVDGTSNSWTKNDQGVRLHPFPNRTTEYQLKLVNLTNQPKKVDVELFTIRQHLNDFPASSEWPSAEANQLLEKFQPLKSLVKLEKLELPTDGSPVTLPFPEPENGPTPEDDSAEEPTPNSNGESNTPPKSKGTLTDGLIVSINDEESSRKTIYALEITPQRPKRYIEPRVSYNFDREQVEIRVLAHQPDTLPSGEVVVEAEFTESLEPGSEARLTGSLSHDEELVLYAEVSSAKNKQVTLHLHVDGFPRAFIYRIRCDTHQENISVADDVLSVHVQDLPKGLSYPAATNTVPVKLQVNAPAGIFLNRENVVRVGIDVDRDREFEGDQTLNIHSDRQALVYLKYTAPNGKIGIDSTVSDFELDLETAQLKNIRTNVLANIISGDKVVWSDPVEVVFDGAAPSVSQLQLAPNRTVTMGTELSVFAVASDNELSGVEKVEAGFDIESNGKLSAGSVAALLQKDGNWMASLPTAELNPGPITILVRAIDRVGNAGEFSKIKIRLITKEEQAAERAAMRNRVAGFVTYGATNASGVSVVLIAPPAEEGGEPQILDTVKTDEEGNFVFPRVPIGKFLLTAEGTVRNKNRTGHIEIDVKVPPTRVPFVELKVR